MEIVMALLFTFGVLAIESYNSTSCEEGKIQQSFAKSEQVTNEPFVEVPQRPCRFTHGSLVQRDITVPYPEKGFELKCQDCRCEGRDCSYNPSAFPPSAVHGRTNAAIAGCK